MYQIVKKSRAVQCVILIVMLCAMISIYPVRVWDETIPSVSNQEVAGATDSIGEDYLLQRFIAQYDHLGTIHIYIADFEKGWNKDKEVHTFIFRMMDSDMQIMFEELVDVRFVDMPGFCPIYVNEKLEVGKDYYLYMQGMDGSRVWFGVEETATAGTQYVSRLVYNYDEVEGYNIIGEYEYTVPLRKEKIAEYYALLLAAGLLLTGAVGLYYKKSGRDSLVTVDRVFRTSANLAVVTGTIAAVVAIGPLRMFDFKWTDNLFYITGVILLCLVLLYGINRKRDRAAYVPFFVRLKERGPDWLQSAFIAGAIWACCDYMNGLYDIHHRIAERKFLLFFALAAAAMCAKKEIWNKITAIYLVIGGAAGIWYYQTNVNLVPDAEMGVLALKNGIIAVILSGFVILNILLLLYRKKKLSKMSLWYGAVLGFFFVLAVIFRNGRGWTYAMALSFTVFYIRYALWDKKEHLLQNICNGILLHFICGVIFSVLHRPFLSWIYPRFPFVFHTVTVTAVYLMVVVSAAMILLSEKLLRSGKFCDIWKELLFLGTSCTYLLFTASRTGFMSVAVIILLVIFCTAFGKGREKIRNILRFLGLGAVAVIVCFPIVFTAQRILPAVNNDVKRYEVETFPDAITRGNEINSMYYINIERFIEVFNNKIFGIPEGGSSSYERSAQYQEYRAKRFNNKGEVVWDGNMDELYMDSGNSETVQGTEAPEGEKGPGENLNIIGNKTEEERALDDQKAEELKQDAQNAKPEDEAQEETVTEDVSVYEATEEYANGRLDIFQSYLEQLNLKGHEEMGAVLPDQSLATHAHNIYLQVAFDHGIIVGILFLVVGAATFVQGVVFYRRNKNQMRCACLPMVYTAGFAVAGMVEWIFHLCNPAGFVLLLVLAPLLFDMGVKKDKSDEKGN